MLAGDPHIKPFDRTGRDDLFVEWGDYWIVKSDTIWIQGRYIGDDRYGGKSWVKEVAISDPSGHNLVHMSSKDKKILTFDGAFVKFEKSQGHLAGEWSSRAHADLYTVTFPKIDKMDGVMVLLYRHNKEIDMVVQMYQDKGQTGHCGNFDKKDDGDDNPSTSAKVDSAELLFDRKRWNPRTDKANPRNQDVDVADKDTMADADIMTNKIKQWNNDHNRCIGSGQLALRSVHGKWFSAERDGSTQADRGQVQGWEKFRSVPIGRKMAFKSAHGKYLVCEEDGSVKWDRTKVGDWEKWYPVCKWGKVGLQAWNGKWLKAEPKNGKLSCDAKEMNTWETFTLGHRSP